MNDEPITITITPEDAEKSGPYHDGQYCLLATAAQREGIKGFKCGGTVAWIGQRLYRLDDKDSSAVTNAYHQTGREGQPTVREPFTVTLRP